MSSTVPISISRIVGRAEEGSCTLRPFRCETDDGTLYWVKGRGAGNAALCREWLAARLAETLGLPIAPFAFVEVPAQLVRFDPTLANELGPGICFGSRHVQGSLDFPLNRLSEVPFELRQRILLFDWLVRNEDRYLGPSGGNVNLLWTETDRHVHLIDHNLAFDTTFDEARFISGHVFSSARGKADGGGLAGWLPTANAAATRMDEFWRELPSEWTDAVAGSPFFSYSTVMGAVSRVDAVSGFLEVAAP